MILPLYISIPLIIFQLWILVKLVGFLGMLAVAAFVAALMAMLIAWMEV